MFSILGGQWRGRKLKALDREGLRPTLSRVKASIFSILESIVWKKTGQPDFSDWRCLDLYAGVGGLGLEMLSRGAAHCVFVERDRTTARVLKENIESLYCGSQTQILIGEVSKAPWEKTGPYHLVLIDPPYAESRLPELLERIVAVGALHPGGIVLFEHDPNITQGEIPGLTLHSSRTLGPAGITVYLRDQ